MLTLNPIMAALAAPEEQLNVRVWSGNDPMRVVIDSKRPIKFRHSLLRNSKPYRLVLDLQDQRLTPRMERSIKGLDLNNRLVSRIRPGQFKSDVLRLVFDLKRDVKYSVATANGTGEFKHRIIVMVGSPNAVAGTSKDAKAAPPPAEPKRQVVRKEPAKPKEQPRRQTRRDDDDERLKPVKTKKADKTIIVVIDPGHGGADPGAVGRRKTYEKTVVLAIAKKLAARINRTKGMKAILTRDRDVFVRLGDRAARAVKEHAHMFVSIHADAWLKSDVRGSSIYTLGEDGASSLEARWLAQSQNRSDEIAGVAFNQVEETARSTVVDLLKDFKIDRSLKLGGSILKELAKLGPLHKKDPGYAEFAVLKAQGIPSVLVETAFISNPREESRLRDSRHQARFAKAIYDGIRNILKTDAKSFIQV